MFEFYPYATEKGNIPNTKVSKINFPNNNFGASILYFENDGLESEKGLKVLSLRLAQAKNVCL